MRTSPYGKHDGENYAIHEGDDGEVEADWFACCGVFQEATALMLRTTPIPENVVFIQVETCECIAHVFVWCRNRSDGTESWLTGVLRHGVFGCEVFY